MSHLKGYGVVEDSQHGIGLGQQKALVVSVVPAAPLVVDVKAEGMEPDRDRP
jgi:hypothetical protein